MNTIPVRNEPLSFYVDKINRREPFTSLLYGDGEFWVMSGEKDGVEYTHYRELVTPTLRRELLASLDEDSPDILRGTDPHLINPHTYQGNDKSVILDVGGTIRGVLGERTYAWTDGVVWENAVRAGEIGSLLKALHGRSVILVGNHRLSGVPCLHPSSHIHIPAQNCYRSVDYIEGSILAVLKDVTDPIVILCVGLSAIPLAMRTRQHRLDATILDLGSTFDMFVGLGAERGWRNDLYRNRKNWNDLIRRNTEGVCNESCPKGKV